MPAAADRQRAMTDRPMQPTVHAAAEQASGNRGADLVERIPAGRAARILAFSAGAGLLAQLLFVGQQPGINLGLWVSAVLGAALLTRRPDASLDRLDAWLPLAALTFGWLPALRDDLSLQLFNVPAAAGLTLASTVAMGGQPVTRLAGRLVAQLGIVASAMAVFGGFLLGHGFNPRVGSLGRGRLMAPLLRSLLIALPLLVIFVALFSAADAVFSTQLAALTHLGVDVSELTRRLLFATAAGWLFAGAMVAAWLPRPAPQPEATAQTAGPRLGALEATLVLLILDAAFAAFVLLQLAYLFGGLDTLAVSGLTYAEYARRGFFELMAVAVIVGLVLAAFSHLVGERTRAYRGAAVALAVLTGFVLLSAAYRLGLYQAAYGWTELRLYVLAMISWLGIGLFVAIVGLAIDRRRWLAHAVVGSALAIAVVVNLVGPHAFVTERNLERAINPALVAPGGHSGLDTDYLEYLGADAVPAMVAAVPRLAPAEAADLQRVLRRMAMQLRQEAAGAGWPSWSYSRHRALEVLAEAGY